MKWVAITGHSFIKHLETFLNNDQTRKFIEKNRETSFRGTFRNFFYISSEAQARYFAEGGSRVCGGASPFQKQFEPILDFSAWYTHHTNWGKWC